MIRKFYNWTLDLAAKKHAVPILAGVSFTESSFFPIPPDALLIPMCLAKREKAFYYAFICTLFSVLGGIAGYAIGYFFFEAIAEPILNFYGKQHYFDQFAEQYNEWGAWIVLGAGVTPFPYKVITIASGVTQLALPLFIIFSVIARSIRFFLVAGLIYMYGAPILRFVDKYLPWVATAGFVLLLGGFAAFKFLG